MKLAKWPSNWGPFLYALGSGGIIFKSAWGPDADLRAKVLIHLAAGGSWALIHTNVGVAVLIVTPDKTTASDEAELQPVIDCEKPHVGQPVLRRKV